jgi:hypothetical protein
MTPTPPVTETNHAPASDKPLLVPPEEQFWKRYSPHHEFPLSSVTSITFYCVLGIAIYVVIKFGLVDRLFGSKEALPVEPIALAGSGDGGGGTGGDGTGDKTEDLTGNETEDKLPDKWKPEVPLTKLDRPEVNSDVAESFDPKDVDAMRYIEEKNVAVAALGQINKDVRDKLMQGLRNTGSKGKDGGRDGGADKGTDMGVGPGNKGAINVRQKRQLRWVMMFDTANGNDYARQLSALGAILGVPGEGGYGIVRDLNSRPAVPKAEDLTKIRRIFWIDSQPASVRPLVTALGLKPPPDHIVAFFPEKLEGELLRKELKFKGRKEHEILETRFRVIRRGNTFEPMVVDQR